MVYKSHIKYKYYTHNQSGEAELANWNGPTFIEPLIDKSLLSVSGQDLYAYAGYRYAIKKEGLIFAVKNKLYTK